MKYLVSHVRAQNLMADDRFKMGGEMYQIVQVATNDYDDKVIRFVPWLGNPTRILVMIVPKATMFKIYNLSD